MPAPKIPEADFIELFESMGAARMAEHTGMAQRTIYQRRASLEKKHRRQITAPLDDKFDCRTRFNIQHPQRHVIEIRDGVILVGSDPHYWPGYIPTAHRAFVKFCKRDRPKFIIVNGDALDASSISRHPPIGWDETPTVVQEIEVSQQRLGEIEKAAPNAERVWPLGNHDGRFETRLATVAKEYAKVHGFSLKDHFPYWYPCWACWINPDGETVVVKHRFKGGMYAGQNNALWAGVHIGTGHLHKLRTYPITDYNGTRYGFETGCMADIYGKQFVDYTEDSPRNWQAGFMRLSFVDGKLMWPEPVYVVDENHVGFRGELIEV